MAIGRGGKQVQLYQNDESGYLSDESEFYGKIISSHRRSFQKHKADVSQVTRLPSAS